MPQVTKPARQREASSGPCMWGLAGLGPRRDTGTQHGWGGCQHPQGPEPTAAAELWQFPTHRVRAAPVGLCVGQGPG